MLQNAQGNILKNKPIAEKIISEEIEKIEKDPTTAFMKHKQSISKKVSSNVQKRFEEELDIDFTHHTGVYKDKYADYRWKKVAMWFKLTKETEDA
jgi:hypothetical protein